MKKPKKKSKIQQGKKGVRQALQILIFNTQGKDTQRGLLVFKKKTNAVSF